jgi:hypothetical protein
MKEIPASARILFCTPPGLSRPPAMTIPITHEHAANSMSFRLPTWSTSADPTQSVHVYGPVDEGRRTCECTRH